MQRLIWLVFLLAACSIGAAAASSGATYPDATVVSEQQIGQIREDRYPVIDVVRLYSTDSLETVLTRFQSANPGWAWRDREGQGPQSYPVRAEVQQFIKLAPGARTEIRIETPVATSALIDVDDAVIANTTQLCVAQERTTQKSSGYN